MTVPSDRSRKHSRISVFWFVFFLLPFFVYIVYSLVLLKDSDINIHGKHWRQYRNEVFVQRFVISVPLYIHCIIV